MAPGSTGRTVDRERLQTREGPDGDDNVDAPNVWLRGSDTDDPGLYGLATPPWLARLGRPDRPSTQPILPPRQRRLRRKPAVRRRTRRIAIRSTLGAIGFVVVVVATSVTRALLVPGNAGVEAHLAEWARDHDLGRAVTWLENQQYQAHPAKKGGSLSRDDLRALEAGTAAPAVPRNILTPIPTLLADPAPFEGRWSPAVVVNGIPVVQVARLRSDPDHTSYLSAVAWIDQKHARFVLHPGSQEPGGARWSQPPTLALPQRTGLIATYNGGFRLTNGDSKGGFYLDGRQYGRLHNGQASEVFLRDGTVQIGQWGRDVVMNPNVVGVRQNLVLLVDNGRVNPSVDSSNTALWGLTVDNAYFVWRSGVGITADGNLVYAMGPALSVRTLAELLQRAGAVRAMELDINSYWASFMTYGGPNPANPIPTKLLSESERPANRYFGTEERDFVAVYSRSDPHPTRPRLIVTPAPRRPPAPLSVAHRR